MSSDSDDFTLNDNDLMDAINPNHKKRGLTKEQIIYGIWAEDEEEDDSIEPLTSKNSGKTTIINEPIQFTMSNMNRMNNLNDMDILNPVKSSHIGGTKYNSIMNEKRNNMFAGWDQYTSGFGMKMLLKMGYKAGKGLGRDESGIVEPIKASVRPVRVGLGANGPEIERDSQVDNENFEEMKNEGKKSSANWKKSSIKKREQYTYKTLDQIQKESENINTSNEDIQKQKNNISKTKVIDMRGKHTQIHEDYNSFSRVEGDKKKRLFRRFDVPELVINIKHILNISEGKISSLYRKNRANQDLVVNYTCELNLLRKQMETTSNDINKLNTIIEIIQSCFVSPTMQNDSQYSKDITLESKLSSIDPIEALNYNLGVLEKLVYFIDYFEYGLSSLCVPLFYSWLQLLLVNNDIIHLNQDIFEFFKRWCQFNQTEIDQKALFNVPNASKCITSYEMYEKILWYHILPPIKNIIIDYTQPLSFCNDLVEFISKWNVIFPKWFIQHLFTQIIYPKLKNFVEEWNPNNTSIPIHLWIHPWVPLFEDKGEITEQLFYIIKLKLCGLLKEWHPSNRSIKSLIIPWLNKLPDKSINNTLLKMITPKLEGLLANDLEINPSNQIIEPLELFLEWYSIVPDLYMVNMLDRHFFTKWLIILHQWLTQEQPKFEEIAIWYKGWKSMIPKSLLTFDATQRNFTIALYMINHKSQGHDIGSNLSQFISYYDEHQRQSSPIKVDAQQTTIKVSNFTTSNFKDMVEYYASERGILFKPLANNMSFNDGKKYYQFGDSTIYIDRGVLFVNRRQSASGSTKKEWSPISLQDLVESVSQE